MGSLPVKATYRGPIVNMSGVIKGEFPPRLREASLKSHGFSFSLSVLMILSARPFCWCTWGILCSTSIPFSFIRVVNALDMYSPPASDIHFCTLVLKIISTITKKYLVACNAASLVCKLIVQAWEE